MTGNVSDAEPTCVEDAIEMNDNKHCSDAMADDITSLVANKVFYLVKKTEGRKIVASQ